MVREILTVEWCDLCMREDKREQVAESHKLVIDGKAYDVDLCSEHVGEFKAFTDLVALASATNRDALPSQGRTHNSPHKRPCLLCSYVAVSSNAMQTHLRNHHGLMSQGEMYGLVCPLCKHKSDTPQTAGMHARRKHRAEHPFVTDTPTAFAQAELMGDPHGVVARARKAALKRSDEAMAAGAGIEGARQALDGL